MKHLQIIRYIIWESIYDQHYVWINLFFCQSPLSLSILVQTTSFLENSRNCGKGTNKSNHSHHRPQISNKNQMFYILNNIDFLSYIFSVSENTKIIHLIMMIWLLSFIVSSYKLASGPPKDPGGSKKILSKSRIWFIEFSP